MLDKALVKFPVGVQRRWEQVTQYVRTRTQEEIVFMVKVCVTNPCPDPWQKFIVLRPVKHHVSPKRNTDL